MECSDIIIIIIVVVVGVIIHVSSPICAPFAKIRDSILIQFNYVHPD